MTSRIGDGKGSVGRLADIAEEARAKSTEAEEPAKSEAPVKADSHEVTDGIDRDKLRNVFHTWKSKAKAKAKTGAEDALRPPSHSGSSSPVEIREKKPENPARLTYEIIRQPADLNADQVSFDVRINGRDYEMAVRGPITEAQLEKIAANSARACNVLSQSGVKSFEKATLESSGGVRVDNPQLGARGPVADQVRSTMREAKLNAPLDALKFESDGSVGFQVSGQDQGFQIPAEHMRAAPFKDESGALSNLAEALKTYAQLSCPELKSDASSDVSTGDDPVGQVIMRPLPSRVSESPGDRPNASAHVSPANRDPSVDADTELPTVTMRPKPSASDASTETTASTSVASGTNTDAPTAKADASSGNDAPTRADASTNTDAPTSTTVSTGTGPDTPAVTTASTGTGPDAPTVTAASIGTGPDRPTVTTASTATETPTASVASDTPIATTATTATVTPPSPDGTTTATASTVANPTTPVSASETTVEVTDTDAADRAAMTAKLTGDPLKGVVNGAMDALNRPITSNAGAIAPKPPKKKPKDPKILGVAINKEIADSKATSEVSKTGVDADGNPVAASSSTTGTATATTLKSETTDSVTTTNADGSTGAVTNKSTASVDRRTGALTGGTTSTDATTNADGSSASVTTSNSTTIRGNDIKTGGTTSETVTDADGNAVTNTSGGTVEMRGGKATITGTDGAKVVSVGEDGSKTTTENKTDVQLGKDKFKVTHSGSETVTDADGNTTSNSGSVTVGHNTLGASGKTTETDADGNSVTTGGSVAVGTTSVKVTGEHARTDVDEDGSKHSMGVSGGVTVDDKKKTTTITGKVTTSDTDADGNKSSSSTSGTAVLTDDGKLKTATGEVKTSETVGDTTSSDSTKVKVDSTKGTGNVTHIGSDKVTNEDGSSVTDTSKSTLDVNVNNPSIKASTSGEHKETAADGSSVANRTGVSGGVTENSVSIGANVGRTTTDTEGDSLKHDHKVGVTFGSDKTTISGTSSATRTDKHEDGGHDKIGGSTTVGVSMDDDSANLNAATSLNTEKKTVDGDTSTTSGTKHSVGFDTAKKDVKFSTGASRSSTDPTKSDKIAGNIGVSLKDGISLQATHAHSDKDAGSAVNTAGGLTIGRDGKPALVGDLEFSNTDADTGMKAGHGIGGGISSKNIDVGYRYTVTTPAGRMVGGHIDIAITRDKVRGVVGVHDMAVTKTGTTTNMTGMSGNLLVGADDVTVAVRHNAITTEAGKILPTNFTTFGGFASFRGNQLTTVGDVVTDESSPNVGEYPVETTRKIGGSIGLDAIGTLATAGPIPLGIGGGLTISTDKEVYFRTHLSQDRAQNLAEAESRGKLKHHLAGATLIDAPIDVPNLSEPDELRVGDHVKLDLSGTIEASVFASAAIVVQAGVKATVTGNFELTVDKTGENTVEVQVVPTKIIGGKLFADAILAEAYVSYAVAQQIGQKFRFDLSTDSGRRAYQQALKGKLPGGLTTDNLDATKHNLGKLQREFTKGVERLEVTRSTSRQKAAAVKAGLLFATAGVRHARTRAHSMRSDGETTSREVTYTRSTEYDTLLSGTEDNGTSGTLHSSTKMTGNREFTTNFEGYTATAYFSDTKVRGDEYASEMIRVLNEDLDTTLAEPAVGGQPQGDAAPTFWESLFHSRSRRVEAKVEFTPKDIVDIKDTDPEEIPKIAERHNVSEAKINGLISKISSAERDIDAARHLDDFLRDNGRAGLGVLIKLADVSKDEVIISTESGHYQGVISDSNKYLLENGKPLSASVSKKDLTHRFKQGERLLKDTRHGMNMLRDDPVLKINYNEEEREKLETEMRGKRDAIDNAMDFAHLEPEEALSLWVTLDRGWTTGTQHRAQERIIKDAGLTLHETAWTRTSASATTEQDGIRKEVSVRSSHKLLPLFGDERTQVAASVQREVGEDGAGEFKSFTFETRIIDESLRWNDMNSFFVDRVNNAYGPIMKGPDGTMQELRHSEVAARGEQQLVLRQTLQGEDLDQIIKQEPDVIIGALKAAGLEEDKATKLGGFIANANDRESLVRALEHFIQDEGIVASGALHRIASLVDPVPEFHIDSISGAIKSDFGELQKVVEGNAKALGDSSTVKDVSKRFKAVESAKSDLKLLQERVRDYPFYSDEQRNELSTQLNELAVAFEKSMDLSNINHDTAVKLYTQLDRGWTSSSDYKAMERIENDTGLQKATSTWTGGLRSGVSLKESDNGTSVYQSSATKKHGGFLSWGGHQEKIGTSVNLNADNSIQDLNVKVELSEKGASKGDFFNHFIERIQGALGQMFPDLGEYPDVGHDRTVTIDMKVDAGDIETLRKLHDTELPALLEKSSMPKEDMIEFLNALRLAPHGKKQGEVISSFLNDKGMEGMGALKMVLGKTDEDIQTTATNGLIKELQGKVDATLGIFDGTKLEEDMSKKELTMRYEDITTAQDNVTTMLNALKHDPFLKKEESEPAIKKLEELQEKLSAAFNPADLTFEERHHLISELEAGWTTNQQYEIIDVLKYQG